MKNTSIKYSLLFLLMLLYLTAGSYSQDTRGLNIYGSEITEIAPGRQIALIIAINNYKEWFSLQYPVKDAISLKNTLSDKYWFTDIIELYDEKATKSSILRQLDDLARDLKPEDSLFIYFAGHGYKDESTEMGFWIPQDAGLDTYGQLNWIPNAQIRAYLAKMRAKHVLLIADSCFSGDILNSYRSITPSISNEYFREAYSRRSRQVITSGSSEVVPDQSSFTQALIRCLEENSNEYLDPLMIYVDIRLSVENTMPLFGTLVGTDHQDGGSFIFFLKNKSDLVDKTINQNKELNSDTNKSKENISIPINALSYNNLNGKILLPANIYGTDLYINGERAELSKVPGTNYLESSDLPPAWYKIKITGRYPYTDTIEIRPGGRTELTAWRDIALSEALRQKQSYEKTLANRPNRIKTAYIASSIGIALIGSVFIIDRINYYTPLRLGYWYDPNYRTFAPILGGLSLIYGIYQFSVPSEKKLNDILQKLNDDIRILGSY